MVNETQPVTGLTYGGGVGGGGGGGDGDPTPSLDAEMSSAMSSSS
jgi:hypothetical protein